LRSHGFRAALGLPACTHCDRLWNQYVKASEEHIRLIEQKLSNGLEPELREALESKIEAVSFFTIAVAARG
jgi:hypothetical protein